MELTVDEKREQGNIFTAPNTGQPPRLEQQARKQIKAVEEEHGLRLDFHDAPRLLPVEWHKKLSPANATCDRVNTRLPDIRQDGSVSHQKEGPIEALTAVNESRYIVELDLIGRLIPFRCYVADCPGRNMAHNIEFRRSGAALVITIRCDRKGQDERGKPLKPHTKIWHSSTLIQNTTHPRAQFYAINLLLPSATILTGNHGTKVNFLLKALNIRTPGKAQFHRIQQLVVGPVVVNAWKLMSEEIASNLKAMNATVVIAGDAQHDSPGSNASFGAYTQLITRITTTDESGKPLHQPSNYIAAVEIINRRHTGLNSVALEPVGFLRSLVSVAKLGIVPTVCVTDAHRTIASYMSKAKVAVQEVDEATQQKLTEQERKKAQATQKRMEKSVHNKLKKLEEELIHKLRNFPDMTPPMIDLLMDMLKNVRHQLDCWHRSKNLGKALWTFEQKSIKDPMTGRFVRNKFPTPEDKANYGKIVSSIKRHWWYCAKTCGESHDTFVEKWRTVLHHVKEGNCSDVCEHGENIDFDDPERPKKLPEDSPMYLHIKSVVTDKRLLNDIPYYLLFLHTSELEAHHNETLKYCPKRVYLSFLGLTIRKILACMDHNVNVHRPIKLGRNKRPVYGVRWSKRVDRRIITLKKVPKNYHYLKWLLAAILIERATTTARFGGQSVGQPLPNDPNTIAPNIGKYQESKRNVMRHFDSRFGPLAPLFESDSESSDEEEAPTNPFEESQTNDDDEQGEANEYDSPQSSECGASEDDEWDLE